MTSRDSKAWRELFGVLCATYDRVFDEAQSRFYFDILRDCELADVKATAQEMSQTSKWFPKPAEWRQAIGARRFNARRNRERELASRRLSESVQCDLCQDTGMRLTRPDSDRYTHCECRESNVNYLIQGARGRLADEQSLAEGPTSTIPAAESGRILDTVHDFKRLQSGE